MLHFLILLAYINFVQLERVVSISLQGESYTPPVQSQSKTLPVPFNLWLPQTMHYTYSIPSTIDRQNGLDFDANVCNSLTFKYELLSIWCCCQSLYWSLCSNHGPKIYITYTIINSCYSIGIFYYDRCITQIVLKQIKQHCTQTVELTAPM